MDNMMVNTKLLDKYITAQILKPNYRKYNIEGAPFKIGNSVKVLNNPNNDETFNTKFSGNVGIVFHFEYDCGCGQTYPADPMIGVLFSDNKIGEFWKEEIELLEK